MNRSAGFQFRISGNDFLLCAALFILNVYFKYPYITLRDLSWDEPFSVFYAQYPLPKMLYELFKGNNPPLWELILKIQTFFFGLSETSVRMPALVFSGFTAVFLFLAGKRFKGTWAGLFVALLFTFNTTLFFYSLVARAYSLFTLLVAASVYYCVVLHQEPDRKEFRNRLLLVNILMCYTHYFAFLVFLAQGIAWLFTRKEKVFFKSMGTVLGYSALAAVPIGIIFLFRDYHVVPSAPFVSPSTDLLRNPVIVWLNGLKTFEALIQILCAGVLSYIVFSLMSGKFEWKNSFLFVLFLTMFLIPVGLTWYFSATYPVFIDRYYMYSTVPLYLFLVWLLYFMYKKAGDYWPVLFMAYLFRFHYREFAPMPDEYLMRKWKGATLQAQALQQKNPGAIILIQPLWAELGFAYYYQRDIFHDPEHHNDALRSYKVHRLISPDTLVRIIEANPGTPLVYYCDESASVIDSSNDANIKHILRRGYVRDTTVFYPLCTNVVLFTPEKK